MAERRMFAKTIIDSDAFLDMPLSTQSLYFHLSMRADDDGFINSTKKIQRLLGCTDDDLRILFAKNFIIPFEDGVCVIKHWKIHNLIQKDRYKPTVYGEHKQQLSLKNNNVYTMDTKWIQNVSILEPQVRLGKVSLGKEKLTSSSDAVVITKVIDDCPHQEIIALYHEHLPMLTQIRSWTDKRRKALKARWSEDKKRQSIDWWEGLFKFIAESDFLTGKDGKWQADLEWIIQSQNLVKIIEGKYHNKGAINGK